MQPIKYIGEQFYIDHRITINGVAQPLNDYTDIKALFIGNNGELKFSYPAADGYNTIVRPDDYTLRYFITSDHTRQLGIGNVKIEIMATRNMEIAPNGVLKPIFVGDIFILKPSKIGQNG